MKKYLSLILFASLCVGSGFIGGGSSSGGGSGSASFSSLTGSPSDNTALQTALDGKVGDTGDETIAGVKTLSSNPILSGLTASRAVVTDGSKALASLQYTDANTASTLVSRDGSGNFSAGTITAALSGNASTATALASNPSDCGAGEYATAIAANGNLTCSTPSASAAAPFYGDGGDVSAPDFAGNSGTSSNTGWYLPATDTFGLACNGVACQKHAYNLYEFGTNGDANSLPVLRLNSPNIASGGNWAYMEIYDGTGSRTFRWGLNPTQGNQKFGATLGGVETLLFGSANNIVQAHGSQTGNSANSSGVVSSRLMGTMKQDFNTVSTGANTTETNHFSIVLPANFFFEINDAFEFESAGHTAANANNKQIRVYLGSAMIYDSGALALNDAEWKVRGICADKDADNNQQCYVEVFSDDALLPYAKVRSSPTQTASAAITFRVTMTNGTANAGDMVGDSYFVRDISTKKN